MPPSPKTITASCCNDDKYNYKLTRAGTLLMGRGGLPTCILNQSTMFNLDKVCSQNFSLVCLKLSHNFFVHVSASVIVEFKRVPTDQC